MRAETACCLLVDADATDVVAMLTGAPNRGDCDSLGSGTPTRIKKLLICPFHLLLSHESSPLARNKRAKPIRRCPNINPATTVGDSTFS